MMTIQQEDGYCQCTVNKELLKSFINPAIGSTMIKDITSRLLLNTYVKLSSKNSCRAKSIFVIELCHHLISQTLDAAVRRQIIQSNPARKVQLSMVGELGWEVVDLKEITGIGYQELMAIKWSDIDLENGTLNMTRLSGDLIALSDSLVTLLKQLDVQQSDDLVFSFGAGGPFKQGEPIRGFYEDCQIEVEEWWRRGNLHRASGPARIWYYNNGTVKKEEWYYRGQLHRNDGAAVINYNDDGSKESEVWYRFDDIHSDSGPAKVVYDKGSNKAHRDYFLVGSKVGKHQWEHDCKSIKATGQG